MQKKSFGKPEAFLTLMRVERTTCRLGGGRSIQLSYSVKNVFIIHNYRDYENTFL